MQEVTYYPGSCGELIQGRIEERDLLISCPVNLYTRVNVFEAMNPLKKYMYPKSNALLNNLLSEWGYSEYINCLDVDILSGIPLGKGFASSTADLCGVYYSLIKLFKRNADMAELVRECIRIEPTDSIIFDGLTLFDYRCGKYFERLGNYIEFHLLVFEGEKIVDTIEFNNSNIPSLSDVSDILHTLRISIEKKDLSMLGEACTISINRNQGRIYYEALSNVLNIKEATGGLGVLGGHSGDVLAIIYDDADRVKSALKYNNHVKGYKCYPLKSLRSVEYEDSFDYSAV